jgi:phosphopantothenoylcysteine decarboxylase/phosphopantothenate--cysteine ligase
MFEREDGVVSHIELADSSELLVVAPATADYLARCAAGRADDLISAVTLAFTGPVAAAPAMNVNMWDNPATRRNVRTLSTEHGWRFVEPGTGELACGWTGPGRMAEPDEIAHAIGSLLNDDLVGARLLITAGPTVEDIDPVRFVSNRSSGRMGYALAERGARRGADVVLITGPTALPPTAGVEIVRVRSAAEMEREVTARAEGSDAVIMAAAVADYRPAQAAEHKLKKPAGDGRLTLEFERNPDILAGLGERFPGDGKPILVGFALETVDLERATRTKLRAKGVQIIVGNLAAEAIGGNETSALIVDDRGRLDDFRDIDKGELADRILDLVRDRIGD